MSFYSCYIATRLWMLILHKTKNQNNLKSLKPLKSKSSKRYRPGGAIRISSERNNQQIQTKEIKCSPHSLKQFMFKTYLNQLKKWDGIWYSYVLYVLRSLSSPLCTSCTRRRIWHLEISGTRASWLKNSNTIALWINKRCILLYS